MPVHTSGYEAHPIIAAPSDHVCSCATITGTRASLPSTVPQQYREYGRYDAGRHGRGTRALVIGHTDEERVVSLADSLKDTPIKAGDSLLLDTRSGWAYERIPQSEVELGS